MTVPHWTQTALHCLIASLALVLAKLLSHPAHVNLWALPIFVWWLITAVLLVVNTVDLFVGPRIRRGPQPVPAVRYRRIVAEEWTPVDIPDRMMAGVHPDGPQVLTPRDVRRGDPMAHGVQRFTVEE